MGQMRGQGGDQRLGAARVCNQRRDHLRHIHRRVVVVPAVIIGDHGHAGIAQLGLAGEFGLGHPGHADDISPPPAIHQAFGAGGKLRPFHRKIGRAVMHAGACRPRRRRTGRRQPRAGRMGQRDVADTAGAEEAFLAGEGAVDILIDQHEIPRRHVVVQRADGRNRHHIGAAELL